MEPAGESRSASIRYVPPVGHGPGDSELRVLDLPTWGKATSPSGSYSLRLVSSQVWSDATKLSEVIAERSSSWSRLFLGAGAESRRVVEQYPSASDRGQRITIECAKIPGVRQGGSEACHCLRGGRMHATLVAVGLEDAAPGLVFQTHVGSTGGCIRIYSLLPRPIVTRSR